MYKHTKHLNSVPCEIPTWKETQLASGKGNNIWHHDPGWSGSLMTELRVSFPINDRFPSAYICPITSCFLFFLILKCNISSQYKMRELRNQKPKLHKSATLKILVLQQVLQKSVHSVPDNPSQSPSVAHQARVAGRESVSASSLHACPGSGSWMSSWITGVIFAVSVGEN